MDTKQKFWNSLIKIRNYEYHLALRSSGKQIARLENGRRDISVLVALVYLGVLFSLAYLIHYYGNVDKGAIKTLRNHNFVMKLLIATLFIILPIYSIVRYISRKLGNLADIPQTLSEDEFHEGRKLFLRSLAICGFFCFGFGMFLMRYVIHGIDFILGIVR